MSVVGRIVVSETAVVFIPDAPLPSDAFSVPLSCVRGFARRLYEFRPSAIEIQATPASSYDDSVRSDLLFAFDVEDDEWAALRAAADVDDDDAEDSLASVVAFMGALSRDGTSRTHVRRPSVRTNVKAPSRPALPSASSAVLRGPSMGAMRALDAQRGAFPGAPAAAGRPIWSATLECCAAALAQCGVKDVGASHSLLRSAQRAWVHGDMSTYDYLLILNFCAGRSFSDLSAYPIFPWVIADYTSATLDLNDPAVYRNLAKPVGALSAARLQRLEERMEAVMNDGTDPPGVDALREAAAIFRAAATATAVDPEPRSATVTFRDAPRPAGSGARGVAPRTTTFAQSYAVMPPMDLSGAFGSRGLRLGGGGNTPTSLAAAPSAPILRGGQALDPSALEGGTADPSGDAKPKSRGLFGGLFRKFRKSDADTNRAGPTTPLSAMSAAALSPSSPPTANPLLNQASNPFMNVPLPVPPPARTYSSPLAAAADEALVSMSPEECSAAADALDALVATAGSPFLYGTPLSAPAYVVAWLVRAKPQWMLRLQSGKFDNPGRMFRSIALSYHAAMTLDGNVQELIPAFYTPAVPPPDAGALPPETVEVTTALRSAAEAACLRTDMGTRRIAWLSADRSVVPCLGAIPGEAPVPLDVELPPWAHGDAEVFVGTLRAALESPIVSANIHKWIDLVFGYAARGPEAVARRNAFHPLSYSAAQVAMGVVGSGAQAELDDAAAPISLSAAASVNYFASGNASAGMSGLAALPPSMTAILAAHVRDFGQMPGQLFASPHPTRRAAATTKLADVGSAFPTGVGTSFTADVSDAARLAEPLDGSSDPARSPAPAPSMIVSRMSAAHLSAPATPSTHTATVAFPTTAPASPLDGVASGPSMAAVGTPPSAAPGMTPSLSPIGAVTLATAMASASVGRGYAPVHASLTLPQAAWHRGAVNGLCVASMPPTAGAAERQTMIYSAGDDCSLRSTEVTADALVRRRVVSRLDPAHPSTSLTALCGTYATYEASSGPSVAPIIVVGAACGDWYAHRAVSSRTTTSSGAHEGPVVCIASNGLCVVSGGVDASVRWTPVLRTRRSNMCNFAHASGLRGEGPDGDEEDDDGPAGPLRAPAVFTMKDAPVALSVLRSCDVVALAPDGALFLLSVDSDGGVIPRSLCAGGAAPLDSDLLLGSCAPDTAICAGGPSVARALCVSADEKVAAVLRVRDADGASWVDTVDIYSGTVVASAPIPQPPEAAGRPPHGARGLALLPDGVSAAVIGSDGSVYVVDLVASRAARVCDGAGGQPTCVAAEAVEGGDAVVAWGTTDGRICAIRLTSSLP